MKKILITLVLLTSIGFCAQAQMLFDFDVEIDTKVKSEIVSADIAITLKIGELPINYQLMPINEPEGEALFESGFIDKSKYKFRDIPKGMYLAKVLNKDGLFSYKLIEVTEE